MDNENKESPKCCLNKRHYIRYIVREFSIGTIGNIVSISRDGMTVKKNTSEEITETELTVTLLHKELKVNIVWQNKDYLGFKYAGEFDALLLIKALAQKINTPDVLPKKVISNDAIASVTTKDFLSSCMNLMEELENPDVQLDKLRVYVDKISEVCDLEDEQDQGKAKEAREARKERETKKMMPQEPGSKPDTEDTETELTPEEIALLDLKELLIEEARREFAATGVVIDGADFAIARLGVEAVKRISTEFLCKKISITEIPLPGFKHYQSYNIFKTTIFNQLSIFYGFKDEQGEGSQLLAHETKGIELLIAICDDDCDNITNYYTSAAKIYSDISRIYEKSHFGTDLLLINKYYFEHRSGIFQDLYDGYILAHFILHPYYTLDSSTKLSLTPKKLKFSFLAYLTFIATRFLIDNDKGFGDTLAHTMIRNNEDKKLINNLLNNSVTKANLILKKLGLSENIKNTPLPQTSFNINSYLKNEHHYKYLLESFENFSRTKEISRIAVRYEDESYTHFILSKLMIADDIGLNAMTYCVIPCKNISDDNIYLEDFSFFDLVIFKDIESLPASHMKEFTKMWQNFEGKLIVTFNSYSLLDFENTYLYNILKDSIVDFPSYFSDRDVYEKMVDHTIEYLQPFIGKECVNKADYLEGTFSMNYIKTKELTSYN